MAPYLRKGVASTKSSGLKMLDETHDASVVPLASGIRRIQLVPSERASTTARKSSKKPPRPETASNSRQRAAVPVKDQSSEAMIEFNSLLSKLTQLKATGWKAQDRTPRDHAAEPHSAKSRHHPKNSKADNQISKVDEVLEVVNGCYTALHSLRKLDTSEIPSKKVLAIEKAGLALVNHVMDFRLFSPALRLLDVFHAHLQALTTPSSSKPFMVEILKHVHAGPVALDAWSSFSKVLNFHMPRSGGQKLSSSIDEVVVLLLTAVAQGFQAFLKTPPATLASSSRTSSSSHSRTTGESAQIVRTRAKLCLDALQSPAGSFRWLCQLKDSDDWVHQPEVSQKVLMSAQASYTAVVQACASWEGVIEPQLLFKLRKCSVLSLLSCHLKLNELNPLGTLFDQFRRALLLYVRASSHQLPDVISETRTCFSQIIQVLQHYQWQDKHTAPGKANWKQFCRVIISLARKNGDSGLIDLTIPFLDVGPYSDSPNVGAESPLDPNHHAKLLLSSVTVTVTLLEDFLKTGQDRNTLNSLSQSVLTLATLNHLLPSASTELRRKSCVMVDRLRRICARIYGQKVNSDFKPDPATIRDLCRTVLEAIVDSWSRDVITCADKSSLSAFPDQPMRTLMISGSVETLVDLAESLFQVSNPQGHIECLEYLSRCEALIKLLPQPDISVVRCLTSAYYNCGVALYHAGKLTSAIEFVRPSCEIPNVFFNLVCCDSSQPVLWDKPHDPDGEFDTLRSQLLKRWELLALCYLPNDNTLSYRAYVSALATHSTGDIECIGQLVNAGVGPCIISTTSSNLCKLIHRATRVAVSNPSFTSNDVSLIRALPGSQLSSRELGAILELQLHYLEQNTRKPKYRQSIKALVEECLSIYEASQSPLSRARNLCRLMQWHVSLDQDLGSIETSLAIQTLLKEVISLTESYPGAPVDLPTVLAQQYVAQAHVWRALYDARFPAPESCFVEASEAALDKLESLYSSLPSSSLPENSQGPHAQSKAGRRTVRSRAAPVTSKPSRGSNPPTTPTSKNHSAQRSSDSRKHPSSSLELGQVNKDSHVNEALMRQSMGEPDALIQQLRLFAHVLGAHGLGSLKLRTLRCVRQLCKTRFPIEDDTEIGHVEDQLITALELASTYLQFADLGRFKNWASQAEMIIKSAKSLSSWEVLAYEVSLLLLQARCACEVNDVKRATSIYTSARDKWTQARYEEDYCSPTSELSSIRKVIRRTKILQVLASASLTSSYIQEKQGILHFATESAVKAVRLLYRASSNLSRITIPPQSKPLAAPEQNDVFSSEYKPQDCVPLADVKPEVKPHTYSVEAHPTGELTWQIIGLISVALERVIILHMNKGSPRIADSYLDQFTSMADRLGSRCLMAAGMAIRGNILSLKHQYDSARTTLDLAIKDSSERPSPELFDLWQLKCDLSYQSKMYHEAKPSCRKANQILKQLNFAHLQDLAESQVIRSPKNSRPERARENLLHPLTLARFFCTRAHISRALRNPEELLNALSQLSRMPVPVREKVFEATLLAALELDRVLQTFRVDPLLGVLPEAMVVIPRISRQVVKKNSTEGLSSLLEAIASIDHLLSHERVIGSADVPNLYKTLHILITLKFVMCVLERNFSHTAKEVAALLDFACSITIRREVLENINIKLRTGTPGEDIDWPCQVLDTVDTLRPGELKIDSEEVDLVRLHWNQVSAHHRADLRHPSHYRCLQGLPTGWRVVSIHLSLEQDSIFLVQHLDTDMPLVVKLPLDRLNRREGEEEFFTLAAALAELQLIVNQSNAATQRARHVSGHNDKVLWWQERKELDNRLQNLVENIENNWLGACKGLLRSCNTTDNCDKMSQELEKLFRRHLLSSQDKRLPSRTIEPHLIESFISLPCDCRDEDLEDLIQLAVDSYQIQEAPVIGDEVDTDRVVMELRDIQKEYLKPRSQEETVEDHLFLILDKALQGFPWEVLPILNGQSVSRIPSLSFLRDRLIGSGSSPPLIVNSKRTCYILNPSGDLKSTQSLFATWLEGNPTWTGIKGRAPSSDEVKQYLLSSDLMLYFGHGGGEQYIRSTTIKQLPRCATTMLWGCSSGMLQDQGNFDPTGTPYAYLLAGCPALLANLWDVTDKDIDRLAIELFKQTGLHPANESQVLNSQSVSLTYGLAQARSTCQLKYLNGAAPVVYGIPVKFKVSS